MDGLLAGIAIADRAGSALPFPGADGAALILTEVRWPLMTVPFLAGVAQARSMRLVVHAGPGVPAIGIGLRCVAESCREIAGLELVQNLRIECGGDDSAARCLSRLDGSIPVDDEVYASLDRLAWKTYVPESAESQMRGAGGGELIETD